MTCSQSCAGLPRSQNHFIFGVLVCDVRYFPSDQLTIWICWSALLLTTNMCLHHARSQVSTLLLEAVYLYIQVQLPSLVTGGVWCPESCNLRPSAWWLLTTPLPRPWSGPDKNYKYYIQIIIPVWVLIWNYHHNCLWSKSSLKVCCSNNPFRLTRPCKYNLNSKCPFRIIISLFLSKGSITERPISMIT